MSLGLFAARMGNLEIFSLSAKTASNRCTQNLVMVFEESMQNQDQCKCLQAFHVAHDILWQCSEYLPALSVIGTLAFSKHSSSKPKSTVERWGKGSASRQAKAQLLLFLTLKYLANVIEIWLSGFNQLFSLYYSS